MCRQCKAGLVSHARLHALLSVPWQGGAEDPEVASMLDRLQPQLDKLAVPHGDVPMAMPPRDTLCMHLCDAPSCATLMVPRCQVLHAFDTSLAWDYETKKWAQNAGRMH